MKLKTLLALAVSAALCASLVAADKVKSGLEPGTGIPAFDVVKCAGAPDDGVKVGEQLCYRCKNGANPQVMVFARTPDKSLAALATGLDSIVAKNSSKNLRSFVNLLGSDRDELESTAKKFGESNKLTAVPVVVPVEFENGPGNYGISADADVTVLIANKSKVVANHALAAGELNEAAIKAIMADVQKLVE